ncbi:shikimate kinase [Gracilibacillus ureilyticus]|uniref:Shikimate kinase n=1 Tax=Gracilibacillus ureilyticus TaxID=531814 RepID=A0A1H9LYP6_9BACI|nr:shikimate kinase [Gracilibacillus ureilyticus]SER16538.1 shikimate kinase [Gracilibacillus ureilyticus]
MQSIYLVGFMGSGKTSVAEKLKEETNKIVLDTDQLIVEEYGLTIPEIFEQKGEAVFREYESSILKNTPVHDAIIATGGGIIEKEENRKWLKENGKVIFLQTSWDEINRRLIDDQSRPIWNNQSRDKQKLLNDRTPKYKEVADIVVTTDGKELEMIVNEILSQIKL